MTQGVGRLLLLTAGRAALQRALPLYVAIMIGAALAFGGNGLSPHTVAELSARARPFRIALHLGWALASLPAVKAIIATESTFVFRTLPISRFAWFGWTAALLAVVELPWTLLWLSASGFVPAIAETCWVLAASALSLSPFRFRSLLVGGALSLALLQPETSVLLLVALPAAALTTFLVWLRAPELPRARPRPWVRGPAVFALGLTYVAVLSRTAAAQLSRGLALVAVSIGIASLQLRNSDGDVRLVGLAAMTPALLLALAGVAGPLLRAERDLTWLMSCTGADEQTRRCGAYGALAGLAVGAALCGAAVLSVTRPLGVIDRLLLFGEALLAAATSASIVLTVARWAVRDGGRDAARLLLGLGTAGAAAVLSLIWLGKGAVLLWCPIALVALLARRDAWTGRASTDGKIQMLDIEGVRKRLGARLVLDGVSARCSAGDVLVVLGENGAGKSTLLRVVAGIVEPDAGTVTVCGAPLGHGNREARKRLGYAPDTTQPLPDLLVAELVALVRALKSLPRQVSSRFEQRWWDRLGLDSLCDQRLSSLSFGQRKRALTAVALTGDPWLLVLDEPSNGLDPAGVSSMLELIAERRALGQATLLASNDAPFVARLSGTTRVLRSGRLTPA